MWGPKSPNPLLPIPHPGFVRDINLYPMEDSLTYTFEFKASKVRSANPLAGLRLRVSRVIVASRLGFLPGATKKRQFYQVGIFCRLYLLSSVTLEGSCARFLPPQQTIGQLARNKRSQLDKILFPT